MADQSQTAASETNLVMLARLGDDEAFEELVYRRQGAVRGLLRRLSGDPTLADDLAQETFVRAWTALHRLRTPAAFGGWLRQIAVNTWLQHARRVQIPVDPLEAEAEPAVPEPRVSLRLDLEQALARLRAAERLCVTLAYAEGMSHREVAMATGFPLGTTKSHIARGAAKLRRWLERDTARPTE